MTGKSAGKVKTGYSNQDYSAKDLSKTFSKDSGLNLPKNTAKQFTQGFILPPLFVLNTLYFVQVSITTFAHRFPIRKMSEIPSKYDPASTEDKWYAYWMEHKLFKS